MKIQIIRLRQDFVKQTLGHGIVFDGLKKVFEFNTLELPWLKNQKKISCIPAGRYWIKKYNSPKFGIVFLYENVKNRSMIEMHSGNYYTDILGCQLPGAGFTDINNDGLLDVYSSRITLNRLLELMPDRFQLSITWI